MDHSFVRYTATHIIPSTGALFTNSSFLTARIDPTDWNTRPAITTPVDVLLASVGHCIVKSIQWAAEQKKLNLNAFTVEIIGTKALDAPNRLAKIDAMIIGQIVDNAELSERILKQAKAICTVSNTLNCDVTLSTQTN